VRELSLHILDLIENSLAAGAAAIEIAIEADPAADRLTIAVEDDGSGFTVPQDVALDPFYSTKAGRRTGLGLSLLAASAQRAGGGLSLGRSQLGGAKVVATMHLHHIDRPPVGDLAATFNGMAVTNPSIDFRLRLHCGGHELAMSSQRACCGGSGAAGYAKSTKKNVGIIHSFLSKVGLS